MRMSCASVLRHCARSLPLIMSVGMLGATVARAQPAPEATVPLETLTVEGQASQPKKPKGKKSAAKKQQPSQQAPSPAQAPDLAASAAGGPATRVVTSGKRAEDPLGVPAGIDIATPADLTPRNFTNLTDLDRVFVDTN